MKASTTPLFLTSVLFCLVVQLIGTLPRRIRLDFWDGPFLIPEVIFWAVAVPSVSELFIPFRIRFDNPNFLDFMVYTRGTFEDYDRYAAVTNDPTWSWDSVQEFFAQVA